MFRDTPGSKWALLGSGRELSHLMVSRPPLPLLLTLQVSHDLHALVSLVTQRGQGQSRLRGQPEDDVKRAGKDSGAARRAAVTMGKTQTPLPKSTSKRHHPALLSASTGPPALYSRGAVEGRARGSGTPQDRPRPRPSPASEDCRQRATQRAQTRGPGKPEAASESTKRQGSAALPALRDLRPLTPAPDQPQRVRSECVEAGHAQPSRGLSPLAVRRQ